MSAPLPDPVPGALAQAVPRRRRWDRWLVVAILLGAGVAWGLSFTLLKIAATDLPPYGLAFWQAAFGTVLLICVQLSRRKPPPLGRAHVCVYVACGILGTALPTTLFVLAAPHVPAGVVSITVATVPMLTFALACLFRVEGFRARRLAGVALGALAIVLLIGPETSLPDPAQAVWVLVALAGSSSYAFENMVLARFMPKDIDPVTLLTGMQIAATAILAPVALASGEFRPALFFASGAAQAAVPAMALINVAAYAAFVLLIARAGPVFASQIAYVVTLAGVVWGMAVLGESHGTWVWAALVAMIAGLALVQPRRAPHRDAGTGPAKT